jgi:hypothetical protein
MRSSRQFADCGLVEIRAKGEEMNEPLSLSIFTIKADRKPVLAFPAKKYEEAEAFFRDESRPARAASRSPTTLQFCAFGWQLRTSVPATAKEWKQREIPR